MSRRNRLGLVAVVGLLIAGCNASAQPRRVASSPSDSPSGVSSATRSPTTHAMPTSKQTTSQAPRPVSRSISQPSADGGPLVVLNPGHNGGNGAHADEIARLVPSGFGRFRACDTTGTSTDAGYAEHSFNWDVTLRVQAILRSRGVRVLLTRPDDAGVGPCIDVRSAIGNQVDAAAFVSIHADGAAADGHGFHVCEDSRQPAGPAIAAMSHRLTVAVHDSLVAGSGLTTSTYLGSNGYFPRDDLAGLNLAQHPATFLELGNMRNGSDAALQSSPSGRAQIAAAVAAGILVFLFR